MNKKFGYRDRLRVAYDILSSEKGWRWWPTLAYAIGLILCLPYDWLENHTIAYQAPTPE